MDAAPRLRGRTREMRVIDAALAGARSGQGAVVLIDGRAGLGKTRLLEEALRIAERFGMRTGLGRADIDETAVPMSALMSACFGGQTPMLDREKLAMLRTASVDRYWLLLELEEMLERAAREQPMLICLDDLQWADTGTADALRSLPVRMAGVPIVWLVAYRAAEASVMLMRAIRELEDEKAARLVLDPLSGAAVAEVITDLTNAQADGNLLGLTDSAHGVPFFLIELLRGLLEEGLVQIHGTRAVLVEDRLPSRVRDSMRERLERVSGQARQAAIAGSVLGRSFRLEDVATMLDTTPAALVLEVAPRA